MRPFDLPANANTPVSPALYLANWPLESCAVAFELAANQYRCWADMQRSLFAAAWGMSSTPSGEPSPMVAFAAADMRAASAAIWRAQMDAMYVFRHSA